MKRRTPKKSTEPLVVRPHELADMLGITPDTLRKWRKTGRGPAFVRETPRSTVYLRATVENWLRANQQSRV